MFKEVPYTLSNETTCKFGSETDCFPNFHREFGPSNGGELSDLEEATGHDICYFVDELGVEEIWVYSYHGHYSLIDSLLFFISGHGDYELDILEHSFSFGTMSQQFEEDTHFGFLLQSEIERWWESYENNLPECENSYSLFNHEYDGDLQFTYYYRMIYLLNFFNWLDQEISGSYFPPWVLYR